MKKIFFSVFLISLLSLWVVPLGVGAQSLTGSSNTSPTGSLNGGFGGNSPGGFTGNSTGCSTGVNGGVFTLCNPLSVDNFCDLIKKILEVIIALGVPIAVLFLVWSGFRFIFARGRPEELQTAKKNFMYVIIGIAVFLGAWTLASIISATIQQLDKSGNIKICSNR